MTKLDSTRPIRCYIKHISAHHVEPSRPRYILLIIHPDADELRRAATKYDTHGGRHSAPADGYSQTLGVFHPAPFRSRYDRKAKAWVDTTTAFAGVLRLCMTNLTTEVVAHEATHAAIHITRLHDWSKPDHDGLCNLGDGCDDNEEAFAYLLGELVSSLSTVLAEVRHRSG